MVQKYLDELSEIMERAIPQYVSSMSLQYKHFFSGAAAYVNDNIFCTHTPKGIAIKIPKEKRDKLLKSKRADTFLLIVMVVELCYHHQYRIVLDLYLFLVYVL